MWTIIKYKKKVYLKCQRDSKYNLKEELIQKNSGKKEERYSKRNNKSRDQWNRKQMTEKLKQVKVFFFGKVNKIDIIKTRLSNN